MEQTEPEIDQPIGRATELQKNAPAKRPGHPRAVMNISRACSSGQHAECEFGARGAEPDASLFTVPAGYTVQKGGGPGRGPGRGPRGGGNGQ